MKHQVIIVLLACAAVLAPRPLDASAIVTTVAGTGRPENNGSAGAALAFNIGQPFGVEVGPDDALYITEVVNHRVLRLDRVSGQVTTVAGNGKKGYSGDGGPATAASLNEPYEVRFDRQGNMYFVEMRNHLVRRVDRRTGVITTVAGTGKEGLGGDGGPAARALLSVPHSIALDDQDRLYIADIGNHRIRRVGRDGVITTIAGTGERRLPRSGVPAQGEPILGPRALFIRERTLWVALREGNSVWKVDLETGMLEHAAGTGEKGYGGDGGPARTASFNGPKGLAVDATGAAFVVDTENQVIRRISPSGTISTIAGNGRLGNEGDGGPAIQARFNRPHGICVDSDGVLYIGDTENHRVRKVWQKGSL